MEDFWKGLMRANARAILVVAILILLLVIAYQGWKFSIPVESLPPRFSTPGKDNSPISLGILSFIQELEGAKFPVPANVFMAMDPPRPPQPPQPMPSPQQPPRTHQPQSGQPNPPPKQPDPPKRDTVSLIYRGIFQRTDGKVLALIEDSKSGTRGFYGVSNDLYGVRLMGIETKEATLELKDGSTVPLRMGLPEVFEGGKRVP